MRLLALSAGYEPAAYAQSRNQSPSPAYFVGAGKLEEIRQSIESEQLDGVIFGVPLSPVQQRNLERELKVWVLDRTGLILDTFARRARSHEGRMQIELARLSFESTRLVRGWTHLERQTGGIGIRGGPGEKQLEIDRRLIVLRIKQLKDRIRALSKQRQTQRRQRQRGNVWTVAIVGYTNAGKSTLFNALTNERVLAADQLFATLDTTTRKLYLGESTQVLLSDTVGFIRDLPHTLIEAFKSTLEEAVHADLLLHVVDAASPVREQQIRDVNKVLDEIGASSIPQWLVWNKADLLEPGVLAPAALATTLTGVTDDRVDADEATPALIPPALPSQFVSAKTGAGLNELRELLCQHFVTKTEPALRGPA